MNNQKKKKYLKDYSQKVIKLIKNFINKKSTMKLKISNRYIQILLCQKNLEYF